MRKEINMKPVIAAYRKMQECTTTLLRLGANESEYQRECRFAALEAWKKQDAKVQKVLDEAQKGARVRLVDTVDIIRGLTEIEDKLGVKKKTLEGLKAGFMPCSGGPYPNAYSHRPNETIINAEYRNGSWWITDIRREDVNPHTKTSYKLTLTFEIEEEILDKYRRF